MASGRHPSPKISGWWRAESLDWENLASPLLWSSRCGLKPNYGLSVGLAIAAGRRDERGRWNVADSRLHGTAQRGSCTEIRGELGQRWLCLCPDRQHKALLLVSYKYQTIDVRLRQHRSRTLASHGKLRETGPESGRKGNASEETAARQWFCRMRRNGWAWSRTRRYWTCFYKSGSRSVRLRPVLRPATRTRF